MIHRGLETSKSDRKKLYKRYQDKWFYKNWSGASTIEICEIRWQALNETGVYKWVVESYGFETWSIEMWLLLFKHNQYFVMSTVLSDDFARDRIDNMFIDWKIHWWEERGGHAHWLVSLSKSSHEALRPNTYSKRRNNHAILPLEKTNQYMNEKRSNWRTYARKYACMHVYK
jgi:hypothetical protein